MSTEGEGYRQARQDSPHSPPPKTGTFASSSHLGSQLIKCFLASSLLLLAIPLLSPCLLCGLGCQPSARLHRSRLESLRPANCGQCRTDSDKQYRQYAIPWKPAVKPVWCKFGTNGPSIERIGRVFRILAARREPALKVIGRYCARY